ncbi:hypothetical protein [Mangrovibacterium lignilyticum]|uniref:hypothetical protein n=1 Tax=Mangrovibacterium lignilyticum TaxID=2668052 RepID=UPI0013D15994|nr:hypothetical protein [Mangrovibacterium lignilyticum]
MKTFFLDIFPKLQRYSKKLDETALLVNQHWVTVDELQNSKTVYIFRQNNDLLLSVNGRVQKAKWEYLGNNSILIDQGEECFLFKHGFFDEKILALKVDSADEYVILYNEDKIPVPLNSIEEVRDFLVNTYVDKISSNREKEKTASDPKLRHDFPSILDSNPENSSGGKNTTNDERIKVSWSVSRVAYSDEIMEITVRFSDGKIGIVRNNIVYEHYYFKEKDLLPTWMTRVHYYDSEVNCINALYLFLTEGKVSPYGMIRD